MNEYTTQRPCEKKRGKGIFLIITVAVLGLLAYFVFTAKDKAEADKLYTFECNSERVEFLNSHGHIVQPDPQKEDITVPAEFNESFSSYNELQKQQGFDLTPYKGKEVTRYTYVVLNYPDYPENIVINLVCDDHRLIAADITCMDTENAFTKPLIEPDSFGKPESDTSTETTCETTVSETTVSTATIPETTAATSQTTCVTTSAETTAATVTAMITN